MLDEAWAQTRPPAQMRDAAERIDHEIRRYFESYRQRAGLFQLIEEVVRTNAHFRRTWQDVRGTYVKRLSVGIRKLQREGRADPSLDAEFSAAILAGMAERAAYLATLERTQDDELLLTTLSRLWRNALGLPPEC